MESMSKRYSMRLLWLPSCLLWGLLWVNTAVAFEVLSVSPDPGATSVDAQVTLGASFEPDPGPASAQQALVLHESFGTTFVPAVGVVDGDAVEYVLPALRPGARVHATLLGSIADIGGETLEAPFSWSFYVSARGFGTFSPGATFGSSEGTNGALGDFDEDGVLDLFVFNDGANTVWLGDGQGGFVDSGLSLGAATSVDGVAADFNEDGHVDVFVLNDNNQPDALWLGDGQGQFSALLQGFGTTNSRGVDVGDLDGDGALDLVVVSDQQPGQVWLWDRAGGTFVSNGQRLVMPSARDVALGDLDGDGDLDAFVANNDPNTREVWINVGQGELQNASATFGGAGSQRVALGDFNADGHLDALVGVLGPNRLWLGNGDGSFRDSNVRLGAGTTRGMSVGDLDGDGHLDFVAANSNGDGAVWLGDGQGGFAAGDGGFGQGTTYGALLGDLNGDTTMDIVAINQGQAHEIWLANRPPRTQPDAYNVDEDIVLTVPAPGVLENDVDEGALTIEIVREPVNGQLALDLNGVGGFVYTPNLHFHGQDSFAYQARDALGEVATGEVTIEVAPVNDPPVMEPLADLTAAENTDVSVSVSVNDIDGPETSFQVNGAPASLSFDPEARLLSGTLGFDDAAQSPYQITIEVNDGAGGSDAQSFELIVTDAPRPLQVDPGGPYQGFEGNIIPLSGLALNTGDGEVTVGWDLDGVPGLDVMTNSVSFEAPDGPQTITVFFCAIEGQDQVCAPATISISNVPPVLRGAPGGFALPGVRYSFTPEVFDPGNDPITLELTDRPEGMTLVEGEVIWTPTPEDFRQGIVPITLRACDDDGACANLSWGIDSEPTFSAPTAPTIDDPLDGTRVESLDVVLTVQNATSPRGAPLTYTFEVYEGPELANQIEVVEDVGQTPLITFTTVTLEENQSYCWRAVANDGRVNGPYSEVACFVVDVVNDAPTAPNLLAPDGSTDTVTPELSIDPSTDPEGEPLVYTFSVFADERLQTLVFSAESAQTAVITDGLEEGQVYFWTAVATDARGASSPTPAPLGFEVDVANVLPTAPIFLAPTDGAAVVEESLTVVWQPAEDANGDDLLYELDIARDASFANITFQAQGVALEPGDDFLSLDVGSLDGDGVYFARVRALDPVGAGPYATISFTRSVDLPVPGAPTLISPLSGQEVEGVVVLVVENVPDAVTYDFEVTDEAGSVISSQQGVPEGMMGTTSVALDPLAPGLYLWSAKAVNEAGEASRSSVTTSFTVVGQGGGGSGGGGSGGGGCASAPGQPAPVGAGWVVLALICLGWRRNHFKAR